MGTLYKAANLAIKNMNGQDNAKNNLLGALGRENISVKEKATMRHSSSVQYVAEYVWQSVQMRQCRCYTQSEWCC